MDQPMFEPPSDDQQRWAGPQHVGDDATTQLDDMLPALANEVVGFGDVDTRLGLLLHDALRRGASDLHIRAGRSPMFRVDGTLRAHETVGELLPDEIFEMLRTTIDDEEWEIFLERRQLDYSLTLGDFGRFRVNAFHGLGTPAAAFRAIPARIPSLGEIGVPDEVEQMASFPYGLVLFVGPTGSGKSTTQAALLGMINASRPCHILTIEDPVEYLHHQGTALVNQREVGSDVRTFADGLRAALREDPDIILLGEMRDEESISITLTLAETGHLVFATLHTNDAAQAMDRIIDTYPADRREQIQTQLSGALQGVVSQRLVPRIGGGRAVACEVMLANDAIRNLIREGKTRQIRNVVATTSASGMRTLEKSLDGLVRDGIVSYEDAIAVSQYPKEIQDPLVSTAIANAQQRAFSGRR